MADVPPRRGASVRSQLSWRNTRCVPADPDDPLARDQWSEFGLDDVQPIAGGHQSRVFSCQLGHQHVVAKLTKAGLVDEERFTNRMDMLEALARVAPGVVAPIEVDGRPVNRRAGRLIVVFPFAPGRAPDIETPSDVALMGRTLAELHRALASIPPSDIGPVAALEVVERPTVSSPTQLLHGDFSTSNLRQHDGRLRVFDFDDCGDGPVEFDVANTLYMELFDAATTDRIDRYQKFRTGFVEAYVSESGVDIGDDTLDEWIRVRRDAVRYWIEHLDQAPIGIRTSPPEWLEQLQHFVEQI